MPLLNAIDNAYLGPSGVSKLYLGTNLVWDSAPPSGGGTAPVFGGFIIDDVPAGDPAMSIGVPTGVTTADYEIVVVSSAGSGALPNVTGWTKLVDQSVSSVSAEGGSAQVGVYERNAGVTPATFSMTISQNRVWGAARCYWTGHSGRTSPSPAASIVEASSSTSHPLPQVDTTVPASIVIGIGVSDQSNSTGAQSWPGFGTFTQRVATANQGNTTEPQAIAIGELVVASPSTSVGGTFTSETTDNCVMAAIVLGGI